MNYNINIYAIKDKENKKYLLVYGFGIETKYQKKEKWIIQKIDNQLKLYKISKVLDSLEYERFIKTLNEYCIDQEYKIEFDFIERNNVISGIIYNFKVNKPTNKLSDLKEFWNIDKKQLLESIKRVYSAETASTRIEKLLKVLSEKTAINFINETYRFGNLEIYSFRGYDEIFKHRLVRKYEALQLYIDKPLNQDMYVKFHSENNERVITNKLKILKKGHTQIEFDLLEDSFNVLLEIWNENGDLVYFENMYYMGSLSGELNLMRTSYNIEDPWTRSIKNSTNHSLDDIERVDPISTSFNIDIDPSYKEDYIYKSINDSRLLFEDYKASNTKGKFIPLTFNRKGELDSFKSVKELIDKDDLKKIIIFDPYFSIKAASKILPRMENESLNIEVITSLTQTDSDTGDKNESYKESFKNFIFKNTTILPKHLKIINILSGKKEAFHDRYILRFLKNGKIDGYILSNSLNSMGQSYPFVIAPLEREITNQIYIYIKELLGEKHRPEAYFKKLTREIIYNSSKNNKNLKKDKEYILPTLLTGINNKNDALKKCIENKYFRNNKFTVNNDKYEEILDILLGFWEKDKRKVLVGIGESLYHSNLYTVEIEKYILDRIKAKDINENEFIYELKSLMKELEENEDIGSYSINTNEKHIYLILNGSASANIKSIYYNPDSLYYGSYLKCLYEILWEYSFKDYIELLEEVNSPMMFLELVKYMRLKEFDLQKYNILMTSNIPYTLELTAYWLADDYLNNTTSINKLTEVLNKFGDYNKLYQGSIIISELIFRYRTGFGRNIMNETDIYLFIEELARLFNESKVETNKQIECIQKLEDLDLANEMKFKLFMLKDLKNKELKDYISSKLIERFIKDYKSSNRVFESTEDSDLINCFIDLLDLNREAYIKEIFSEFNIGSAFFKIKEPLLKEINFEEWNQLNIICSWEYNILFKMQERGYHINEYKELKKL